MTMRLPSGLNATLFTEAVCPLRTRHSWPVSASHTFAVLVPTSGDDAFAVGAERHAADKVCVPLEGEDFLARAGIPHLRRPAITAGDDASAVGAERHAT